MEEEGSSDAGDDAVEVDTIDPPRTTNTTEPYNNNQDYTFRSYQVFVTRAALSYEFDLVPSPTGALLFVSLEIFHRNVLFISL